MIKVMSLMKMNLERKKIVTKRDIYYKDVNLFKTQTKIDSVMQQVAEKLSVDPLALNVASSPKSLLFGDFTIFCTDGTIHEAKTTAGPLLAPVSSDIYYIRFARIPKFFLISEKEAAFPELCQVFKDAVIMTVSNCFCYLYLLFTT